MSSPRSAKFMLDRFGLNAESTEDERCLLINPAVWHLPKEEEEVPSVPAPTLRRQRRVAARVAGGPIRRGACVRRCLSSSA